MVGASGVIGSVTEGLNNLVRIIARFHTEKYTTRAHSVRSPLLRWLFAGGGAIEQGQLGDGGGDSADSADQ